MLGAVQFGVLAACVVLFVPMGMAGWHLSRNKMLFFSGALFITLAVGVHLTPYFPSFSSFIYPISSSSSAAADVVALENRDSCISLLHEIDYVVSVNGSVETMNSSAAYVKSWSWVTSRPVLECGFQKLSRSNASDLLNGSWVAVAGDSQARLVVVSLLDLVLGSEGMESVRGDLFKRHSDYQIVVDEIGMKLDFKWAPYTNNLTDFMIELKEQNIYPDVLLMGAGHWHMLHMTNSSDYGASLRSLKDSVASLLPISPEFDTDAPVMGSASIRSPHLFWLGMPMLIKAMLNTEEKRVKMTDVMSDAYDEELQSCKLLRNSGGPFLLLDVGSLSRKCGSLCSVDGMHYESSVYEPVVHILLNALLIESHQKL